MEEDNFHSYKVDNLVELWDLEMQLAVVVGVVAGEVLEGVVVMLEVVVMVEAAVPMLHTELECVHYVNLMPADVVAYCKIEMIALDLSVFEMVVVQHCTPVEHPLVCDTGNSDRTAAENKVVLLAALDVVDIVDNL